MKNNVGGVLLLVLSLVFGSASAWAGRVTAGGCGAFDPVGWRLASTGLSIPDNAVVGQSLGVIATADVVVSNSTYACNTSNDTGVFNIGLVGAFTNQWPVTGADGLWSTSTPFIKFRVTGNGALIRSFAGNAASPLSVNISSGQIPPVYSFSVPQGVIRFSVEAVVGATGKPPAGTQISTAYLPEASYLLGMLDAADVLTYNDVVQVAGTADGSTSIPILTQPAPSAPSLWLGKNLFSALQVGVPVQYQIDVMNDGPGASGATVDLYDQLPPNMAYVSASNAACAVIGGQVSTGQLLKCTVSGSIAAKSGSTFKVTVTPQAAALGKALRNTVATDSTGGNAVLNPASYCVANANPKGCAITDPATVLVGPTPPTPAPPSTFQYTVPAGIYQISASLTGGGGGAGGQDGPTPGGVGGAGGKVTALINVMPGQVLSGVVGGAGGVGAPNSPVAVGGVGGVGGWVGVGVSAGVGGTGGGVGNSGGGGGGGGASSLTLASPTGPTVLVAGGGGGAQGGAYLGTAMAGGSGSALPWVTAASCPILAGTVGRALGSSLDGGGGGGGGSGATGGLGGAGHRDSTAEGIPSSAGGSCYSTASGQFYGVPALAAGGNAGQAGAWSITPLPPLLGMSKTTAGLMAGVRGAYTLTISNSGIGGSNPTQTFYEQLPPKMAFAGAAANTGGTVNLLNAPVCGVLNGTTYDTGLLLSCTVQLPPGGIPAGGHVKIDLQVTPGEVLAGQAVVNKAQIDPSSQNAVQNPVACTSNNKPSGCAVLAHSVSAPPLSLSKTNPNRLIVGLPAVYSLLLSNAAGTQPTGSSLVVYDQLPPNFQYNSASPLGTGTVTPSAVSCAASGAVGTGQLLTCTLILPAGGLPAGTGTAGFSIGVTPLPAASGVPAVNKAAVDPLGANAVQTPVNCIAGHKPLGCAVTPALSSLPLSLQLTVQTGAVGDYTFSGNNGWGLQSLGVVTPGTAVSGTAQGLTQVTVATRLTETVPVGWALESVNCLDLNAASSGNPASQINVPLSAGNSFELPARVIRLGAALVCTLRHQPMGYSLSGQVIIDNGVGAGGVAHDGVQNGTEPGHSGVVLQLTDCGKTVYASAITDGAGQFALSTGAAPAGPVCLVQAPRTGHVSVSYQVGDTGGSYNVATQTLRFTLAPNTRYSGVLLGEVPVSQLLGDGAQQMAAGQSVLYAHTFVAGTSASVVFSSSDQPSGANDKWSSVLYSDSNCNGRLDAGELALGGGAINVQAGQQLCLLLKVNSPAGLIVGAYNKSTLLALESYQAVPLAGAVQNSLSRQDISAIGVAQGGALSLLKQVRRVASCPSTAADAQPYATTNQAQPGQYVEYQLVYSNNSAGPLTAIRLSDSVPAYTVYRSAGCGPVPTGLLSCDLVRQPAAGGSGALQWDMTDAPSGAPAVGLQPGGSGAVVFCVQIQR